MQVEAEPNDIAAAEAVMVEQCPNPDGRLAVLRRLLATADAANAIAPNAWAVTLFANGFRLNIGQVEAVVFADGELRVNLSASAGTAPFVGPNFVAAGYRSLPQPLSAFLGTPQQYLPIAAQLESAHQRFVHLAATGSNGAPRRGTPFRRSHCEALIQYARRTESNAPPSVPSLPDIDFAASVSEGGLRLVSHLRRERKRAVVEAKKAAVLSSTGRLSCEVCGFDFSATYGSVGEGFCEVHHLSPLSASDESVTTTLADLAVLCSNCHRIIHRSDPMFSVAELSAVVRSGNP